MHIVAKETITELRKQMKAHNIDAYMIVTDDFHGSEYVGDHFKCRAYMSGFTGSAGTLVVTQDMAGLWTDGRYFLQAGKQLAGSGIDLFKMGEPGVPTVHAFLVDKLKEGQTLGFDGRTVNAKEAFALKRDLEEKGAGVVYEQDLVDLVWKDRPALSAEPVTLLDEKYTGESREERIRRVREVMEEQGADLFVLSSLDDIAWLLNIRGNDVAYNPVVLSYLVLGRTEIRLYINEKVLDDTVREALEAAGVSFYPYDQMYEDMKKINKKHTVLLDASKANFAIVSNIPAEVPVLDRPCPTVLMKAVKTPVEVENERKAHIKDGVAVCRFLHWIKTNVGKIPMTEISVAEKLEEFRQMGENYRGQSFGPIAAYAEHGAIVHYSATPETDKEIKADSFLLLDTGGQYLEGTTDITRTVAFGNITDEMKKHFTAVLKGNLNLVSAKFRKGCLGINFDYLAREALWEMGLDYNHGTGHGVGYYLNVHEAPNGFRWKQVPERNESAAFEAGMITSDEPGLYLEGKYGIRLENLIVCEKYMENEYGEFLQFKPLTFVPFDLDAVDPSLMTEKERARLNAYHAEVFEKISPYLDEKETRWLAHETRAI